MDGERMRTAFRKPWLEIKGGKLGKSFKTAAVFRRELFKMGKPLCLKGIRKLKSLPYGYGSKFPRALEANEIWGWGLPLEV